MQVRETIEVTKTGLKLCPDLDPCPDLVGGYRLQRHPLQSRERGAHDADRAVGDGRKGIVWLHSRRAYRGVGLGRAFWQDLGMIDLHEAEA